MNQPSSLLVAADIRKTCGDFLRQMYKSNKRHQTQEWRFLYLFYAYDIGMSKRCIADEWNVGRARVYQVREYWLEWLRRHHDDPVIAYALDQRPKLKAEVFGIS